MVIGGAIWSFSQDASTHIANDYVKGIMDLNDEVIELFNVEHVYYNHQSKTLIVWIYNYGSIDVVVDVYVDVEGEPTLSNLGNSVMTNNLVEVDIPLTASSADEVAINAISRRGNFVYYMYFIP
jgi:4-hydroxyphenylpyruvate dioxygenase-like putative hemolysin